MAAIEKKRKSLPTNDSFARSRDKDGRPLKRAKPNNGGDERAKQPTKGLAKTQLSQTRDEEVAFPRGGASILTPLEHKQIQIEATRDVLFEQGGGKRDTGDNAATETKKKSKSKEKSKKPTGQHDVEKEGVRIEGLSYKRIVPGSLVLGQVHQINEHDIALSLPNNLTGYVPITSISEKITKRIEEEAAKEEETDEDEIELEKLFSKGQYLRAYVVSTTDDSSSSAGKGKRRIELSLRPQQSNNALASRNIVVNSMLMASVVSIEDHGLVMDLGLSDSSIKGFMSSKELGQGVDASTIQEGAVILCMVTGLSSNGKIVKLSSNMQKAGNLKKLSCVIEAPTVDAFLPGTAVEVLVTDITARGLSGKVMGMIDVTADIIHSGAGSSGKDLEKKYRLGSKIKGRIICTFPTSDPPKLGLSLLDHVMAFTSQQALKDSEKVPPLKALPLSTTIEDVKVQKVQPEVGLFVDVGIKGVTGFVHISRVKDGKIEALSESSGPYKVGSVHRGRVIGYNALDGEYMLSLEPSVLEQPFLHIEDLKIGEIVKGKVEKIVLNAAGVASVLVNLAEGITGLVPTPHLADVELQHPEKKFREGMAVTARVLSTDPRKRQIRLTLKKSLVNSDAKPFLAYDNIEVGMQSPGIIVSIVSTGAVVQFYGTVRGFLPVSEMSEAYIKDPNEHFRVGQVVNVHVLSVDPEENKLKVSCKDPSVLGMAQKTALKNLQVGDIVSGVITEKSINDISLEIEGTGLRATLPVGHLTDKSPSKNESAFKKIRVGQSLKDLVVLEKLESKRLVVLSNKPSLVKAARTHTLLRGFEDVKEKKLVHGFVRHITAAEVFVQFGGGLVGLLPKSKMPQSSASVPDFGLKKLQSISVTIFSMDQLNKRFLLSMIDSEADQDTSAKLAYPAEADQPLINPVDETSKTLGDFALGKLTKAKIVSVKETQINVKLADNVQGRIDISQVFDRWEDIKDRKRPLKKFQSKQVIQVRIIGMHDARNHRFLPITHRIGKQLVFELSAKPSEQSESAQYPLTLDHVKVGSSWIAYVNNISDNCLWVNLSPNIRGRVNAFDVSDNVSLMENLEANFPVGSAIKVHATSVDVESNRLNLSGRSAKASQPLTFEALSKGMVVPGKVVKVEERFIVVRLSDHVAGSVALADLVDDFSQADTTKFSKGSIIRVSIVDIDLPNKKLRLSTRLSKVLNSSIVPEDREISSASQVQVNEVMRGFVKNVVDKGLFVNLGGNVSAFVRVSDLSDSFIKDWKSEFQIDQLVKGKITSVDVESGFIQMSLKGSIIDKDYVPPITFNDLSIGQVVTGKIRAVKDFGVFVVIDGSNNVSGLCHQSELAEKRVHDVRKLYEEGDVVQAIILKLDSETKKISLGMKASYFENAAESEDNEEDVEDGEHGVAMGDLDDDEEEDDSSSEDEDGGIDLDDVDSIEDLPVPENQDLDVEIDHESKVQPLSTGGFDWSAKGLDQIEKRSANDSDEEEDDKPKKKKRRKAEITTDRTGDLDANGPLSVSDFERLLLGQPDSSALWIQYMAFQMQLSELSKARDVAERAIRTINIHEETEKMNVWIALLNLENTYGSDETVEEVFKRACQYNDAQEMHERLTSIYIQSGKYTKADELFQILIKKFSQSPTVWYNYSHFLQTTLSAPDRARALLPRATQSLPPHTHLALTLKFAALEFHSTSGSPERGRTMFEGLLSTFPRRLDIWNQLLDLEIQQGDPDIIRGVFERVVKTKGIKPKGAKAWFKRWSEWEAEQGDKKSQEKVKARAEEWVRAVVEKKSEEDA